MLHKPVLLREVLELLLTDAGGIYVDGTFGRGGHSRELLARLSPEAVLVGFDKDPQAVAEGRRLAAEDGRFRMVHGSFAGLSGGLSSVGVTGSVTGVLLDLGVSSPQLDDPARGFSFMTDGPLDMRMDNASGLSAADWLNSAETGEIEQVIREYGEERFAGRIARAIVAARQKNPLSGTLELARLVESAVPVREKHKHPATRTFQAVRIWINRELQDLDAGLQVAVDSLHKGGRLAVISFHSLEDRLVKHFFQRKVKGEPVPRHLPVMPAQQGICLKDIGKKIRPGDDEVADNVRARSATLRVVEKTV
jgi:16S rRNA (cytosine1402-N4)-methyltransferase